MVLIWDVVRSPFHFPGPHQDLGIGRLLGGPGSFAGFPLSPYGLPNPPCPLKWSIFRVVFLS